MTSGGQKKPSRLVEISKDLCSVYDDKEFRVCEIPGVYFVKTTKKRL